MDIKLIVLFWLYWVVIYALFVCGGLSSFKLLGETHDYLLCLNNSFHGLALHAS